MPENAFLRKLCTLASGTLLGQLLVVAVAPLLTRLFTPAEFGLFAVFSAVTAIIGVAICLRLEFAIPVLDSDEAAASLLVGAIAVATINALLTALLILLCGAWFVAAVDAAPIAGWLWIIPVAVWLWGLGSLLIYWSLRRGRYRVNGVNRALTLGTQAMGQAGLGLAGLGMPALLLGYVSGYVTRLAHHAAHLSRADWRLLARPRRLADVRAALSANWRFVAFSAPSALLHNACEMLPAVVIAVIYGPAAAGWYALGQRIMSIPIKLLGEAASEVFLGEGRALASGELHRFFLRTTALFITLGILGMAPVLLLAPLVFSFIFGDDWLLSGIFVQLLVPLYFFRFISHPVSQMLNILHRQDIQFIATLMNLLALIIVFFSAYYFQLDVKITIFIYSVAAGASFLFAIVASWWLVRRAAARDGVTLGEGQAV